MPAPLAEVAEALSDLVSFLQEKMPSPELDDIAIKLNGMLDIETGSVTAAMDRRLRRQLAQRKLATDAKASTARTEMFPNASRLGR